ncbi:Vps62-related protein, partial [Janthinobacterium sp. MDT1-19]|uniref:Vps62-related protein n=1 Tax=Janthinobacterium sp. MDT1-19 TaxID=1259339 RepID=UPI003F28D7DB
MNFELSTSVVSANAARNAPFSLKELQKIAKRYAPIVHLHPDEQFFMCSVEWYLQNATLNGPDVSIPSPTIKDLPVGSTDDGKWTLTLQSVAKSGNAAMAKTYVNVRAGTNSQSTDIQYFFFYAYNGPGNLHIENLVYHQDVDLQPCGEHWADWESMTVRVDNTTHRVLGVGLSQHGHTQWVTDPSQFGRVGDQFVIYSSKNGHANYKAPGPNPTDSGNYGLFNFFLRNDTADGGQIFNSSEKLEFIAIDYMPEFARAQWLGFPYRWGTGDRSFLPFSRVLQIVTTALFPYAWWIPPPVNVPLAAVIASIVVSAISLDNTEGVHSPSLDDAVPPSTPYFSNSMGAIVVDNGRPYVYVLGTDGNLWCNLWDGNNFQWSNQRTPSGVALNRAMGAITVDGGRPYVYVLCSDGNLWCNWWDGKNFQWSNQQTPSAVALSSSMGTITVGGARPYVYVLGSDGNLWCNWWDGSNFQWSNQQTPSGITLSTSMGAITVDGGRPYVYVLGSDGNLWYNWWDGNNFQWSNQQTPSGIALSSSMGAIAVDGGRPYVYV